MVAKEQLSLFVACNEFVFAVDVRAIERLVLAEEITYLGGSTPSVQVGRRRYMPFNLGALLELPPTSGASILVSTLCAGAELSFSLETGPCLFVRPQEGTTPLPGSLLRARHRALSAAFALPEALRRGDRAPVGFVLNVDALLSAAERDAAARVQTQAPAPVPVVNAP